MAVGTGKGAHTATSQKEVFAGVLVIEFASEFIRVVVMRAKKKNTGKCLGSKRKFQRLRISTFSYFLLCSNSYKIFNLCSTSNSAFRFSHFVCDWLG